MKRLAFYADQGKNRVAMTLTQHFCQSSMPTTNDDKPSPGPQPAFAPTTLQDVIGCLTYNGPALSIPAMDTALAKTFRTSYE